jgi:FtsP/CotA-like multicopper oxidase with cupredoxin domain
MHETAPITEPRRRDLLRAGAGAVLHAAAGGAFAHAVRPAAQASAAFAAELDLELVARPDRVAWRPGPPTTVWRFDGRVLAGDPRALSFLPVPDGGPGWMPVLRVRRGARLRVRFENRLPEPSIVHWHGLHIPQRMDGHPMDAVDAGGRYDYEFEVDARAGTYWFHPHPHGRTGAQVWMGLAGLLLVGDDEDDASGLPSGERDLPLVIQDRSFDAANRLRYLDGGMMQRMAGMVGDRVFVNGLATPVFDVSRAPHRLRLFNGSNASSYLLQWSDGAPMTLVATDGGLLERAVDKRWLLLGPAERAEVWVDFATSRGDARALLAETYAPDLAIVTARQQGEPAGTGGRPIARFRVAAGDARPEARPGRLSAPAGPSLADVADAARPRTFRLAMRGPSATINGRTFDMGDMTRAAPDETVRIGDTEVWEYVNEGGMPMAMAHPMHVHNLSFRVLSREGPTRTDPAWRALAAGFTDEGLKDTVMVLPREQVRILLRFEDHLGPYLQHCHILEHEDMGMMRNYVVAA